MIKNSETKPKVIMMIGLPGSGKSSKAKELSKETNAVIHSSDELRKELFGFEDQTKNSELFKELHKRMLNDLSIGKDVIYDATNLNKKKRKHFINHIVKDYDVVAYFCVLPIELVLERNKNRLERVIPKDKLMRMYRTTQVPLLCEGFKDIKILTTQISNILISLPYLYNKYNIVNYNQNSSYHTLTLDKHISKTFDNYIDYCNVRNLDVDPILCFAIAFHDLGKPTCRVDREDGYSSYIYHENISAYLAALEISSNIIELSKISSIDLYRILTLISHHIRAHSIQYNSTKRRLKKKIGEKMFDDLMILKECDENAK